MSPDQPLEHDVGPGRQGTGTEDMVAYGNLYKKASSTCMWGQQRTQQLLCLISVVESEGDKEARLEGKFKASILYRPSGPLLYYFNNRRENRIVRLASPNMTWHNLSGKVTAQASLS